MDLNAPLGMTPPPRPKRGLAWLFGGALVCAIAGLVAILATADPHGGEPYAVAVVPRPASPDRAAIDPIQTGSLAPQRASAQIAPTEQAPATKADSGTLENGVRVFRAAPPAGTASSTVASTGPLVIDVSKVLDDPLNRSKASAPAAPPGSAGAASTDRPRVAIFVSGLGLSQVATKTTLELMPAAVTLAFVPYGEGVAGMVATAKAKGHEVLLQIPMENATGGPPGPHALRAQETPDALASDIAWLTGRFEGYDGVTNLLGAPVTADRAAMTGLLKTVGSRGLYYLDDGTSTRSVAAGLAPELGTRVLQADLVLDATSDPSVVAANLDRLLMIAKRKGTAIGMASGLPDHLAAIARFASEAADKGVTLVPVAALAARDSANDVARAMPVTR